MNRRIPIVALTAAVFALGPARDAEAYDLKPMVIQLKPSGAGSAATAVITNTHSVPIALEIRAYRREQLPDGNDKLVAEDRDIILTPPQMVLAPKTSQSFRIQWVGDAKPSRELAYRIVTEQLPIQFAKVTRNDRTADITMKYRYEMALYVEPEGAKPEVSIASAEVVKGKDGARELSLRFRSTGTMRAILDKPVVEVAGGGSPVRLDQVATNALVGLNILPGAERVVRVPAPVGLPDGPVKASLTTEYTVLR